jgi:haloacetate dehalogenase
VSRIRIAQEANGVRLHYVREGEGPLVLLLHGWPQSSHCWRYVMPALAQHFTVIAPDMRGYGLSDKPRTGYDKRTMAADMKAFVNNLGFEKISVVVGHDRGARVSHRMGLDYPEVVERLAVIDLVPTREALRGMDFVMAQKYWHWFMHLQPDLPELFIRSHPREYLHTFFMHAYNRAPVDEALDEYVKSLLLPGAIRASLEDYRMTFGKDLEDDDASDAAGQKLTMPTLVVWGDKGVHVDPAKVIQRWTKYATDVHTAIIPNCGYYMAEEQPLLLAEEIVRFQRSGRPQAPEKPSTEGFRWK